MSPPGEGGAHTPADASRTITTDNTPTEAHTYPNGSTSHQASYDALAANARRFAASRRMAALPPCGCVRDPAHDRHRCNGEITDRMAAAAVAALVHLDELGTPGLLDERTCHAMWHLGHCALALRVHRRTAGAE